MAEVASLRKNNAHLTRRLARAEAIIVVQKTCRPAGDPDGAGWRCALTAAVVALAPVSGMAAAVCAAVGVSRATVERRRSRLAAQPAIARPRPESARALTGSQQRMVLDLLHAPRFADQAPAEIYPTLLDEGVYHCAIRTMYRILEQNGEVRERRQQLRHSVYQKPELLAERPNEVWSWDITKLMGPAKWTYFYLYVILDIFSRRVVGWCVADAETASLFQPLFDDAIEKHNVPPGQLTLHADHNGPMKAKATAFLLADLGVTRSHNRPHTSNDNPFFESHFKTLKYQPRFPKRFGCRRSDRRYRWSTMPTLRLRQTGSIPRVLEHMLGGGGIPRCWTTSFRSPRRQIPVGHPNHHRHPCNNQRRRIHPITMAPTDIRRPCCSETMDSGDVSGVGDAKVSAMARTNIVS
jgi:putative transposase